MACWGQALNIRLKALTYVPWEQKPTKMRKGDLQGRGRYLRWPGIMSAQRS